MSSRKTQKPIAPFKYVSRATSNTRAKKRGTIANKPRSGCSRCG